MTTKVPDQHVYMDPDIFSRIFAIKTKQSKHTKKTCKVISSSTGPACDVFFVVLFINTWEGSVSMDPERINHTAVCRTQREIKLDKIVTNFYLMFSMSEDEMKFFYHV